MRVIYKRTAVKDMEATRDYIAGRLKNPKAAKKLMTALLKAISLLVDNPYAAGKYRLNVSILQPSAPSTDVDAKSSKFITCVASQSTMPSKMPKGVHLLAAIPRRFTDSKCRPGRTA